VEGQVSENTKPRYTADGKSVERDGKRWFVIYCHEQLDSAPQREIAQDLADALNERDRLAASNAELRLDVENLQAAERCCHEIIAKFQARVKAEHADQLRHDKIALRREVERLTQVRDAVRKAAEELGNEYGISAEYTETLICGIGDKFWEREETLRTALRNVMGLIESGELVRDTSKDHERGWAMKQIVFVQKLKAASDALASESAVKESPAPEAQAISPKCRRTVIVQGPGGEELVYSPAPEAQPWPLIDELCPTCGGKGKVPGTEMYADMVYDEPCTTCKGTGHAPCPKDGEL